MTLLNYRESGDTFWNRLTVQPVQDDTGEVAYLASIHEDVTETRRLAQELEHRSRLSAVGELAGGVAHDFRNILTASQGLVELALERIPPEHDAREYLSELRTVTVRGSRVTERLLALSRSGGSDPTVEFLRPLLQEIASLVSHTLRDDVVFSVEAPGETQIPVELDRDQFTHAVLNLVRNAEQAMAQGGELTLEVHFPVKAGSPDWWPVDLTPAPDTWVRITVRDTGPGMDPDTLSRAFDPYFTTKAAGEGTGLGLSSVYGAVESMGGRIWLESEPGEGTAAHILLPTLDPERITVEEGGRSAGGQAADGRYEVGTILLAEDDETVLSVFRRALENGGHRVRAAPDGRTALELFEDDPGGVDLVVTDGVMPQVSGAELAIRVWKRRPGTPVLVTSGFGAEDLRAQFPDEPGGPLIFRPKPLPLEELMDAVEELLSGAVRGAGGAEPGHAREGPE
jgi:two-component system cell cycle sensor histidine kinase/response regulator CckA